MTAFCVILYIYRERKKKKEAVSVIACVRACVRESRIGEGGGKDERKKPKKKALEEKNIGGVESAERQYRQREVRVCV